MSSWWTNHSRNWQADWDGNFRTKTIQYNKSNVTSRHRGLMRKPSWRPLASVIRTLYYVAVLSVHLSLMLPTLYSSSSSVVSHAFSARCVYSKFWHHPHPQATFVPNFISLVTSIAELAHGEKLHTPSITQSLRHSPSLFDAMGTEVTKALVLWNDGQMFKVHLET